MADLLSDQVLGSIRNLCEFNIVIPDNLRDQLNALKRITDAEAEIYLMKSLKEAAQITTSIDKWDKGWVENNSLYQQTRDYNRLAPLYTGKLPYLRIMRSLYLVSTRDSEINTCETIEHRLFAFLYDAILIDRIKTFCIKNNLNSVNLVELGAGSCQHIPRLSAKLKSEGISTKFYISDWSTSTQTVCDSLREIDDVVINFRSLDMLNPPCEHFWPENSIIYTINSFEQLGKHVNRIIDLIISSRPGLVIHFEPVNEVLEPENLYDSYSIEYSKKRGYLEGMLGCLITKQSKNILKIEDIKRTFIANALLENNTFLEWKLAHSEQ